MRILNLVKIVDLTGSLTQTKDSITYQALNEDELDRLYSLAREDIDRDFTIERLGEVQVLDEDS